VSFAPSVLLAVCFVATGLAGPDDDLAYQSLADRAKNGDLTVDFRAMRLACLKASQCMPRSTPTELLTFDAPGADPRSATEFGEKLLDKGFVNVEIHAALSNMYTRLGDSAKANFHYTVTVAISRSILSSGDGKTKETAYEVIADREIYVTLALLQLPSYGPQVSSTLLREDGHSYHRFIIQDPKTNQPKTIYFRTDLFVPKSTVAKE
jgi:hypothetical protein